MAVDLPGRAGERAVVVLRPLMDSVVRGMNLVVGADVYGGRDRACGCGIIATLLDQGATADLHRAIDAGGIVDNVEATSGLGLGVKLAVEGADLREQRRLGGAAMDNLYGLRRDLLDLDGGGHVGDSNSGRTGSGRY